MKLHTRIGLKHSIAGLILSVLAAFTVVFAIKMYAGPVPALLLPCASALAVFAVMNSRMWQSIKDSLDAGEVSRRMHQTTMTIKQNSASGDHPTWFAHPTNDSNPPNNHESMRNKKALQAAGPEGLT